MLIETGVIGLEDIQILVASMNVSEGESGYDEAYDLVQYGVVGLESLQYSVMNKDETLTIIKYK